MPASSSSSASCALCSAWAPNTLRKSWWMAALSSMMIMRRLIGTAELGTGGFARPAGQLENERRSAPRSVALRVQGSAEFLGGEGAAVQAEAVSRLPGGEAVGE